MTSVVQEHVRSHDAKIGLIGTSGYAEQLARSRSTLQARLFERRAEACNVIERYDNVSVTLGDVGQTWHSFAGTFDCVVADPPWYPELTALFVRAAAGLLVDGGTLLLCTPGLTTRPGLPAERRGVVSIAAEENLILDALSPRSIEYESPPFELSALNAGGFEGFDPYWRRSDLMIFRRLPGSIRPEQVMPGEQLSIDTDWSEVSIGRARIRINTNSLQTNTTNTLQSITDGNVLDSVSTRDSRRGLVNVWTTTNHVYATNDPARLLIALTRLRDGQTAADEGEFSHISRRILDEELYTLRSFGIE